MATPASSFHWDGRTLTIDYDGVSVFGLLHVYWDGVETQAYSKRQGSVMIRFYPDFIAAQAPGEHTRRVDFLNHYGETTVMVEDDSLSDPDAAASDSDGNTHNPHTGSTLYDYINIGSALPLGSIGAAALVLRKRKHHARNG